MNEKGTRTTRTTEAAVATMPTSWWTRPSLRVALNLHTVLFLSGCATQSVPHTPLAPPPLRPSRYDESYTYLRDASVRTGAWWEPLKYIPLGENNDAYATFGGELRARYEVFRSDLWGGSPTPSRDYTWLRAMPYIDLHAGDSFRVFAQAIAALEIGDEAGLSLIDENRADILQAFADATLPVGGGRLTIRGGRQLISYGAQRLISTRYGVNVPLPFDAVKLFYEAASGRLDVFYGRPASQEPGSFDDSIGGDEALWGAYATTPLGIAETSGLDVYYLGFKSDQSVFNSGSAQEERHTLGVRFTGTDGPWDWDFEGFGQGGTFGGDDIRAWSAASDTGFTLDQVILAPRFGLKANIISGDRDPNDGVLSTFNPLYPSARYFGEGPRLGPYNLINVHTTLGLTLTEQWRVDCGSVYYWRESVKDGIYSPGGVLLRADDGSSERFLGTQLDVALGFKPSRSLDAKLAYSAFVPGAFIEDTGRSETTHFIGLELRMVF